MSWVFTYRRPEFVLLASDRRWTTLDGVTGRVKGRRDARKLHRTPTGFVTGVCSMDTSTVAVPIWEAAGGVLGGATEVLAAMVEAATPVQPDTSRKSGGCRVRAVGANPSPWVAGVNAYAESEIPEHDDDIAVREILFPFPESELVAQMESMVDGDLATLNAQPEPRMRPLLRCLARWATFAASETDWVSPEMDVGLIWRGGETYSLRVTPTAVHEVAA